MRLQARCQEAREDPAFASLREEISLIDVRLSEMVAQLDSGESGTLYAALTAGWAALTAARDAGNNAKMVEALDTLGVAIAHGATQQAIWQEIVALIRTRQALVESERRRLVEFQQILTLEQATSLISAVAASVKRNVTDQTALRAITADLSRLLVDGAHPGPGAVRTRASPAG
jgi:hypothetical protein